MPLFPRTRKRQSQATRAAVDEHDEVRVHAPQDGAAGGPQGAGAEGEGGTQGSDQGGLSHVLLAELRGQREDFRQTYALIESRLEKLEQAMQIKPKASVRDYPSLSSLYIQSRI